MGWLICWFRREHRWAPFDHVSKKCSRCGTQTVAGVLL